MKSNTTKCIAAPKSPGSVKGGKDAGSTPEGRTGQ